MAANLSQREKKDLHDIFKQFDCDGSGKICCKELKQVMDTLNIQVSDDDIKKMIEAGDRGSKGKGKDGEIDFEEFLNMFASALAPPNEDELKMAFQAFDSNGDNMLTKKEISKACESAGQPLSTAEIDRMFGSLDNNGDGKVNYEEFVKSLKC